jgi:hypothetical protein
VAELRAGGPLDRTADATPARAGAPRDLQEADAALLWLADVEALPLPTAARRLGLDPADAAGELAQVRGLFRERCRRNHLHTPMDARCRSYARLLDAITRSPAQDAPADLSRHLATCARCAEAAACLRQGAARRARRGSARLGRPRLPGTPLERGRRTARRRATRRGGGRARGPGRRFAQGARRARRPARRRRPGVAPGARRVAGAAGAAHRRRRGRGDRRPPVAVPTASASGAGPRSASPSRSPRPSRSATSRPPGRRSGPDPTPRATTSATSRGRSTPAPDAGEPPSCRVTYDLVNQWPDGFQAAVTVTTENPWTPGASPGRSRTASA